MFDSLGLAYRVLDMSPDELGDPAARKYDIEVIFWTIVAPGDKRSKSKVNNVTPQT